MIDTAGTITNAAKALHADGAREVYACTSHAVFSPPAIERLSSGVFQEVIVTNSIPVLEVGAQPWFGGMCVGGFCACVSVVCIGRGCVMS